VKAHLSGAAAVALMVCALVLAALPASALPAAPRVSPECQAGLTQLSQVTGGGGVPSLKGSRPVIFVNGIASGPGVWKPYSPTSLAGQVSAIPGVSAWTFGYSGKLSLQWVTNQEIGPDLAKAITCLAGISGHKVIVVAHSMGGLAAQYAIGQEASHVAELVTIGTPFEGSQILTIAEDLIDGKNGALDELISRNPSLIATAALTEAILSACAGVADHTDTNLCWLASVLRSPVGTALEAHSSAISQLPAWPAGVRVLDTAGDMQVSVGVFDHVKDVDFGDGAVTLSSATAHGTAGPPVIASCHKTFSHLLSIDASLCFHTSLPHNPRIDAAIFRVISAAAGHPALAPAPAHRPSPTSKPSSPRAGSGTATFTYSDNNGDSLTQSYSFGSPVPERQLPQVAQAASSCEVGTGSVTNVSDNMAIPVTVTSTLNSDISVSPTLALLGSDMFGAGASAPVPLDEVLVYDTGQGYTCTDEADDNGTVVSISLTQGSPGTLNAWVVLNGAVSPAYPDGNPASIGVTGVAPQVNPGFSPSATVRYTGSGPAVCTSSDAAQSPFLHIGGTVYGWEDCNSRLSSAG